jgi:hypothetical protein
MSVKHMSRSVVRRGMLLSTVLAICAAPAAAQQGVPSPPPPAAAVGSAAAPPQLGERGKNEWIASVLLGTNFQANTDNNILDDILDIDADNDSQGAASFAFSGQIGYLWNYVGLEGLFDFTPSIDVTRAELDGPSANSYMANLITAIPIGPERRFQPYVSGGFGVISMRTDVQDFFLTDLNGAAVDFAGSRQSKFGWNLGVGTSAFGAGAFGFRADLRYFRAGSNNDDVDDVFDSDDVLEDALDGVLETETGDRLTKALVSGIGYWRANFGLAVRW